MEKDDDSKLILLFSRKRETMLDSIMQKHNKTYEQFNTYDSLKQFVDMNFASLSHIGTIVIDLEDLIDNNYDVMNSILRLKNLKHLNTVVTASSDRRVIYNNLFDREFYNLVENDNQSMLEKAILKGLAKSDVEEYFGAKQQDYSIETDQEEEYKDSVFSSFKNIALSKLDKINIINKFKHRDDYYDDKPYIKYEDLLEKEQKQEPILQIEQEEIIKPQYNPKEEMQEQTEEKEKINLYSSEYKGDLIENDTKTKEKEEVSEFQSLGTEHNQARNTIIQPIKEPIKPIIEQQATPVIKAQRLDNNITSKNIFQPKPSGLKELIAVSGTKSGVGTTHLCLNLVKYLNDQGFKACYLELNQSKNIIALSNYPKINYNYNEGYIQYQGVNMFYKFRLSDILSKNYDFFVFDLGCDNNSYITQTSILKFLVADGKVYNNYILTETLEKLKSFDINIVLNFATENDKNILRSDAGLAKHIKNINFMGFSSGLFSWQENKELFGKFFFL